jgi:exopolyphosphatase / guanosine-5'-triphosphate,3'-diphosphate pyrophosphatase
MRIAAIDIGTNSVHMIVVQVRPDLSFEVIDSEKEMVRLGAGGLDGKALTDTAMTAALQALSKFKRLADSYQVDEIVASATSATREAENGGDFLAEIYRQTGIRAQVITGTEEARLIHLAAGYGTDIGSTPGVVIDIGGGSVEITRGPAHAPTHVKSFKAGVIRLTERFVKSDPLSDNDEARMVKYINRQIREYVQEIREAGFERVIGTSGTILSLGEMALADRGRPVESLRNRRVSAKAISDIREKIVNVDLERRLRLPALDPRRGDIIVAGSVLLDTVLRRLGAKELTLCDLALREGLVLDYIQKNRGQIAQVDRYPDVRRRSVIELGQRCNYWSGHAQHVAQLALSLFDQTRSIHGLTDRERDWLEYGALLHDLGIHISYENHHKHSYYLITNGGLRGFDPEEVQIIALIARYHRRNIPKKSHPEFGALRASRRKAVRILAAMVRLAEGLDRSHTQVISSLHLRDVGEVYLVRLQSTGDSELELWAAQRHAAALESVLGKPIRFEVVEQLYGEYPDNSARVSREAVRGGRDRRVGQEHSGVPARKVAQRGRTSRIRHRMELVGARQGGNKKREKTELAHAHDVQPASRHRLR